MAKYERGFRLPTPGDPDFLDHLFNVVSSECPFLCPFCGGMYNPDDAEYEGGQQVSPNYCDLCGASELGSYKMNPEKQVYLNGWVRERRPEDGDKYPIPKWVVEDPVEIDDWLNNPDHQYEPSYGPGCNLCGDVIEDHKLDAEGKPNPKYRNKKKKPAIKDDDEDDYFTQLANAENEEDDVFPIKKPAKKKAPSR
jgi:hypothetical protein